VYAIGDVHGRLDLLTKLLNTMEEDDGRRSEATTTVILLGDMIDRGPASADVVQLALDWDASWTRLRAIKGNHEAMFLALLEGSSTRLNSWLKVGGTETLLSYGISDDCIKSAPLGDLVEEARAAVPASHVAWLRNLPNSWHRGDYLFVHAGIRPGVALERQSEDDLQGIRGSFLEHEGDHGAIVVHGHSVNLDIEMKHNRIGVDTGAYKTGRLSALGLQADERWTLEVQA
jgi:serine/threonine protein phosphatase 1